MTVYSAPPLGRQEKMARLVLVGLLLGLGLVIYLTSRATAGEGRVIELHARMPEAGGWLPEAITAQVGEPLRLRLTSDDVVHGFAIGQSGEPPVDIFPGQYSELSLVFDQPGKYTFYCTRWCGANHWRMRGVIEVEGPGEVRRSDPPPYVALGIDIDAPHPAQVTPAVKPQAAQAAEMLGSLPELYLSAGYYRSHSPAEAWLDLHSEPGLSTLSDSDLWDIVALIWSTQTSPAQLAASGQVYAQNCAACHGEAGAGDGVFAGTPAPHTTGEPGGGLTGHGLQAPVSFQDVRAIFGASPALLHGKIVRGGMGTGMPYWGPVLTDEEVWALVAYLYSFHFEE